MTEEMKKYEKGWSIRPTKRGIETQFGGPAPHNSEVAYLVFRLADVSDGNFVSHTELIQGPGDENIITYANALKAEHLGYAETQLP